MTRPTTTTQLVEKLREYIRDIERYRDTPQAFDVESDWDYPDFILGLAIDDARHVGLQSGLQSALETIEGRASADDVLNAIGKVIESISDQPPDQQATEPPPPDPDYLTVGEVAERLQVSTDLVYDLCKQNRLEFTKVGRVIRIKPSALDQIKSDVKSDSGVTFQHLQR